MKYIVVILDGAAGWPLESLGNETTLQHATTPILDLMASQGTVGLAKTVPEGAEPSSSVACTSILGYDPIENYVGRAAIEAAAMGITLAPNEIALRINTVNIRDNIMQSYACGHISTEDSTAIVTRLASHLDDDRFTLYPGLAYRHILVVKDAPELLDLAYSPPHDITDQSIQGHAPRGVGAQLLLDYMARTKELLQSDPTNASRIKRGDLPATDMWPFWPGQAPQTMKSFSDTYGKTAALTSGVDLLFGLCELFTIDKLEIAGVTGGPDNDYIAQVEGGIAALDTHDVVIIHVESPDEMGHAGDRDAKIGTIESIDREVMTRVLAYAAKLKDVRVLAMPDHPTPIAIKTHVDEPVPFLLWGAGVEHNDQGTYDEQSAAASGLMRDPGHLVLADLLKL